MPVVKAAVRQVATDKVYWHRMLSYTVNGAAFRAITLSEDEQQALDSYHAPIAFAAEGRPVQGAPNMKIALADTSTRAQMCAWGDPDAHGVCKLRTVSHAIGLTAIARHAACQLSLHAIMQGQRLDTWQY